MAIASLKHRDLTDLILKAFYTVYNELGYGFLENVYENAMVMEASDLGLNVRQQVPIDVSYKQRKVGHYDAI